MLAVYLAVASAWLLGVAPGRSVAQPQQTGAARESAADAYDRGVAAYRADDYLSAARWFEAAYALEPSAAALVQALRSRSRAGDILAAGNIALEMRRRYPNEERVVVRRALREARRIATHVTLQCDQCAFVINGASTGWRAVFVEPNRDHVIEARYVAGASRQTVRGAAGADVRATFSGPDLVPTNLDAQEPPQTGTFAANTGAQPPVRSETTHQVAALPQNPPVEVDARPRTPALNRVRPDTRDTRVDNPDSLARTTRPRRPRIARPRDEEPTNPLPAILGIGGSLTLIAGGFLVWSTLDMYDGVAAYEATPTMSGLAAGQDREARTNILLGVTAGLAGATALALILAASIPTGNTLEPRVSVSASDTSAMVHVGGRF